MIRINNISVFLAFLCFLIAPNSYSQLTETYEIQDFSPETISKNHLRIITGWEYQPTANNSKIVVKTKQSYELFDRGGRLIEQEYYWGYSDIGHLIKKFKYDTLGRLKKMSQSFGDSLELTEYYTYDSLSKLVSWKVDFAEGGDEFDFVKTYEYDQFDNPILQTIKLKDRSRVDTLKNFYDANNELSLTLKYSDTTKIADSIVYKRHLGDTVWNKLYYTNGVIIYKQSYIIQNGVQVYRTTDYRNGRLHKINYHKYDEYGNILENRTFHHYVQGNFKKVYSYNDKFFPVDKKVYKNKDEPETIVKFEYGYY